MDKTELVADLRNMADELESPNWGASWSFDDMAEAMREAASSLSQAEGGEAAGCAACVTCGQPWPAALHSAPVATQEAPHHPDCHCNACLDADGDFLASPTQEAVSEPKGFPYNMPNPTAADLTSQRFEAVWQAIKSWDLNVPEYYQGYCGANGSHVMLILDALAAVSERTAEPTDEQIKAAIIEYRLRKGSAMNTDDFVKAFRSVLAAPATEPKPEFASFVDTPQKRFLYDWGRRDGYQDGYAEGLAAPATERTAEPTAWQMRTFYNDGAHDEPRWGAWHDCRKPMDSDIQREKSLGVKREYRPLYLAAPATEPPAFGQKVIDTAMGKQVWFDRKDVLRVLQAAAGAEGDERAAFEAWPSDSESNAYLRDHTSSAKPAGEPFGYWHQGPTDDESDFFLASESGDVSCENCISLYASPIAANPPGAEDTKRLDWLEKFGCDRFSKNEMTRIKGEHWFDCITDGSDYSPTLRQAIDAAISSQGKKEGHD